MSRECVIDALRGIKSYFASRTIEAINDKNEIERIVFLASQGHIDNAIELLKQPQWVSVKDRMPEDKSVQGNAGMVQVLCFFKFGDIRMCYYGKDHWQDEPHFNWAGSVVDEYVTHWQYMPEPPKEVSK